MSATSSTDQHYFFLANNFERRSLLESLVKSRRPQAKVEVFAHPSAMKKFLETQRQEGVSLSSVEQPLKVFSDPILPNIKSEDEPEYNHLQGTNKVLNDFLDDLVKVTVHDLSDFDTSDPYQDPDFTSVETNL